MPAVSVIVPVRRDSGSLKSVVDRIRTSLSGAGIDCEIVAVFDDDHASEEAATAIDRTVEHRGRSGLGGMLKTGIAAARHETIAVVDPAGGYAVERLPELVRLSELHSMAVGARTGARSHFVRRLCEFATASSVPDHDSLLRVFRRSEIVPYLGSLDEGVGFGTTATLAYLLEGRGVVHLPVEGAPVAAPRKSVPSGESLAAFQGVCGTILRHAPLRLFVLLAAVLAILGIPATGFGFLLAVASRLFDWYLSTGLPGCTFFLAGIGALLASALTLAMGMLAESMISRPASGAFDASPARPETSAV